MILTHREPTTWQRSVLEVPESINLVLAGGRGGGKTTSVEQIALRHVEQYGEHARPLIVRHSHKALVELEDELIGLFATVYGGVPYSRQEKIFRFGNGARVELGQLEGPVDWTKYQGRSYSLLIVEEIGAMKTAKYVQMLRSNLRSGAGIPLRTVFTANPGGALHTYMHSNFISRAPAWEPFLLDGEKWVVCTGTYKDNPHIDHADYERKLRAACAGDEELLRAWLSGDWNIARGAFFGGILDERVHMLPEAFPYTVDRSDNWSRSIAMDYGFAAPSVVLFCARAPDRLKIGSTLIPVGSMLVLDEIASARADDPNVGLGWPPGMIAEAILEKCRALNNWPAHGVGDDARGLEDTLLNVLRTHGIHLQRPQKHRVAGWARVRELLWNAKERNGRPGLYISARCRYTWATLPFLPRNPLRPEDLDTTAPDHAADALRYGVLQDQWRVGTGHVIGLY
jgi:hypothetical protein